MLLFYLLFLSDCQVSYSNTQTVAQNTMAQQIFSDSINEFIVKVVYEAGAAPYTGPLGLSNDTWDVTKSSYQAIFSNHPARTVSVPATLGAFTAIADQAQSSWTTDQLISLGKTLAPAVVTTNKATVTLIFLNGLYQGNSGVLGIHFSGYPFAFVFKDVVTSVGGTPIDQRYVEQATAVHELGHVVGLVNNGIPLSSNYEDTVHPRHSQNTNCVMYWTVESSTSILAFLTNNILANRLNLFEAEPLADGRGYHP